MSIQTTIETSDQYHKPLPWGRWGIRSVALTYLIVMLIIPLFVILQDGLREGLGEFWRQVTLPMAWHALKLTLWTSALMTVINTVMGVLTAFVIVRYDFPGKRLLNGIIDLPLAIPTLVTGVMLVILFGPQEALTNDAGRPIFIVHGTGDTRINVHHTRDLAALGEQTGANLTVWIPEDVGHVEAEFAFPEEYEQKLVEFFRSALNN